MNFQDMEQDLGRPRARLAGLKQVLRAVEGGKARAVVLARDVDEPIRARVREHCQAADVPCVEGPSMQELGQTCRLDVATAVACLLR